MQIHSLSATRIKSYEGCPKRMLAEMSVRTESKPGNFGTALHAALEWFHKLHGEGAASYTTEALLEIWRPVCGRHLGWGSDYEGTGEDMLTAYMESHPAPPDVISQEVKKSFDITTPTGVTVKVNYIIDRVDRDGEYGYRVIDYKSQYGRVTPEAMRTYVQPFLYALALRREYGLTGSIPVTYVMLRQNPQDVTIVVSQADMDKFENYLANRAQDILDDDDPREKLNSECGFCIRKAVCSSWEKATEAGWAPTMPLEKLAEKHAAAKAAEKAAARLAEEIEDTILATMRENHAYVVEAGDFDIKVTMAKRGAYDAGKVFDIMKEAAIPYMKVGKTALDKEVNRKSVGLLNDEQKAALRNAVVVTESEPGISIVKKHDTDFE